MAEEIKAAVDGGVAAGAAGGTTPPPAGGAAAGAVPEAKGPKVVPLGDGDELPDGDDVVIQMSPKAFKKRLNRLTTKELKAKFGTDDVDAILEERKELVTLRSEKVAREREAMTELERERTLRQEAEAKATASDARARSEAETRVYEREDSKMTRLAGKYIDEDFVDAELDRFAKHLRETHGRSGVKKLTEKQVVSEAKDFFADRVKTKPKLGIDFEQQKSDELKAAAKLEARGKGKPVTNGAKEGKPSGQAAPSGEAKTFAKGKANSYTDKEARAKMAEMGIRY